MTPNYESGGREFESLRCASLAMSRANRTAFTRRALNSDPATMRQHHVAAVSAGSDLHPHVQPFAIRNEPLHSSQAAPSTAALHAVWPLTIRGARGAGLAAPGLHSCHRGEAADSSPEIP